MGHRKVDDPGHQAYAPGVAQRNNIPMSKDLTPLKPRAHAIVFMVGNKRPPVDMSLVPPLTGESIRLAFRADAVTYQDVDEHMDRLAIRAAGIAVTPSDALRSLIQRGARAFREDDKRQTDSEDT